MAAPYAITIFLGSFLLFQVQPILAKQLIPLFGGSPAVWTACMLFFQTVLVAGYAYAHGLTYLKKRKQAFVHLCLLGSGLLFLHLDLASSRPVIGMDSPIPTILWLLTTSVGFPFLMLSASAPLLQHWFIAGNQGKSPWKLYALSNAGSLMALLSYPVFFEPLIGISSQARIWGWGYTLYLTLCGVCLFRLLQGDNASKYPTDGAAEQSTKGQGTSITIADTVLWFACSACGSAMLLAVTNQICQQVAVVPFLFVLTLAVYLMTFIACFGVKRASDKRLSAAFLVVSFVFTVLALTAGNGFSLPVQMSLFIGTLVSCCMICHGQLVRLRPAPSALTFYYLVIALGGAGGAGFISLLAPQLFDSYVELPFLVIVVSLLFTVGAWRTRASKETPRWFLWLGGAILCSQIFFSQFYVRVLNQGVVESSRNFYGTLKVVEETDALGRRLTLKHGVIVHGRQYQDGSLRNLATTYYGPDTGAGLALRLHPRRFDATGDGNKRQLRVGLVGLGVGTLASYGETGDTFRFYEIDPAIISLAQKHFSYLHNSKARIEIVAGDARLSLQREARQGGQDKFDILVIDAFSNDTIPVHLITREAVELYLSQLRDDGILLFHISTRVLDLMPVLATHAAAYNMAAIKVVTPDEPNVGRYESHWAILTKNRIFLENELVRRWSCKFSPRKIDWTDKFASIWHVLN